MGVGVERESLGTDTSVGTGTGSVGGESLGTDTSRISGLNSVCPNTHLSRHLQSLGTDTSRTSGLNSLSLTDPGP